MAPAGNAASTLAPHPLPAWLAAERADVLSRALRGLPTQLLAPLLRGLRRHADSLSPGQLVTSQGGCAVGMMVRELVEEPDAGHFEPPRRFFGRFSRWRNNTIEDSWPEMAAAYPRLPHIEIVFDRTCELAEESGELPAEEIPRSVGLWMAAGTQAEINVRHVGEAMTAREAAAPPPRTAALDEELFADTVDRLMALRPELSRREAIAAIESLVGARKLDGEPLFVPGTWEREVELQRERIGQTAG